MKKLATWTLLAFIFLLPLQTHYELNAPTLQGLVWDFNKINVYAVDFLLVAAVVFSLLAGSFTKKIHSRYLIPFIIFCGMLFASTLLNRNEFISWYLFIRFVEGVVVVWLLAATHVSFFRIATTFILSMTLNACFAFWQFSTQSVPASKWFGLASHLPGQEGAAVVVASIGRFLRAYGTLPYPNIMGLYCSIALLLCFWVFANKFAHKKLYSVKEQLVWGMFVACAVVLFFALALTFSRSSLLGLGIGTFLLTALCVMKKIWRPVVTFIAVIVIVAGTLWAVFPSYYILAEGRVAATERHEVRSITDRDQSIRDAYTLLETYWWSGVGLGRSSNMIVERIDAARPAYQANPAENMFVLIAVEGSIFACLAFIAIFVLMLTDISSSLAQNRHRALLPASAIGLVLVVALIAMGFYGNYLPSVPSGIFLLFFVFGLSLLSLERRSDEA